MVPQGEEGGEQKKKGMKCSGKHKCTKKGNLSDMNEKQKKIKKGDNKLGGKTEICSNYRNKNALTNNKKMEVCNITMNDKSLSWVRCTEGRKHWDSRLWQSL